MSYNLTNRWIVMSLALLLGVQLGAPALAASTGNDPSGLWLVHGVPEPSFGVPDFVNVVTVTKDGQVVNVDPTEGAGVGALERISGRSYAVTFSGFIPGGPETWRYVVNSTITLDGTGQVFTGPFRTTVFDLDGDIVFAFEGSINATRQPVEGY